MGGVGSGGRRPGAGRKPKSAELRVLDGNASHRKRKAADVVQHPSAPTEPPPPALPKLDEADAPNELDFEERAVWLELAPHAIANGTLTTATALGFRMLCRNVALEKQYARSVNDRGTANHRGLIQRIDAELLRFNLAPCGKPVGQPETAKPAVDPMKAKYFGGR
jgi:hypothetical protein